jgi:hypothetical protein
VGLGRDSGTFSFFGPGGLELVVKVVDGRAVNGRFWFFYGALSDVEYWLRLTDTVTGAVRLYHNPRGHLASVADTAAMAGSASSSEIPQPPSGVPARSARERLSDGPAGPGGTCGQGSLCLLDGRFEVRVGWQVPGLGSGAATGALLPQGSGESGTFWFFDPNEVELAIKILDGRSINGSFWVFYGALSAVEYDVVVTDTASGRVRTYHNPAGSLASIADTKAF